MIRCNVHFSVQYIILLQFWFRCVLSSVKVPSISVVEQDVDHCTLRLKYLAVIMPELHLEKQLHSTIVVTIPRVVER